MPLTIATFSADMARSSRCSAGILRRGILYRQHFPLLLAPRQAHGPEFADRRAAQGARERGVPADLAGGGILLVVADQGERVLEVVLIGDRHDGPEPGARLVGGLRRIDYARGLHPPRQ